MNTKSLNEAMYEPVDYFVAFGEYIWYLVTYFDSFYIIFITKCPNKLSVHKRLLLLVIGR